MTEKEKIIKKQILRNYARAKPTSIVPEIIKKLGLVTTVRIFDEFQGRHIYFPRNSSLKRAALPIIIKEELDKIEPGSNDFKSAVKQFADFYKTTQKAIIKMYKKGVYLR